MDSNISTNIATLKYQKTHVLFSFILKSSSLVIWSMGSSKISILIYWKVGLLGNVVKFVFQMSFGTFIKQRKYFLQLKIKHPYHC